MEEKDGIRAVELYGNMLYRICVLMLRNNADAQDAVQETLLKYLTKAPEFASTEHEKAWLITVASNQCRNIQRQQKRVVPMETIQIQTAEEEECAILESLMEVPEKFREILILHYVEGYKVAEVAAMLSMGVSAVKMRLAKGRRLLKEIYRKEL